MNKNQKDIHDQSHPDFKGIIASKGGLFDVDPAHPFHNDIGRHCVFVDPDKSCYGTIHALVHEVVGVQKIYDDSIAYRVRVCADTPELVATWGFDDGRPARHTEIRFID